jgi:hypothetical protein
MRLEGSSRYEFRLWYDALVDFDEVSLDDHHTVTGSSYSRLSRPETSQ